jgi:chloramphenicol-sensitive protein RarD
MNRGVLYALSAYLIWGAMPIYLKSLQSVSAFEILAHRVLWSVVFVFGLLALLRRWQWVPHLLRAPRQLGLLAVSALLVSINWVIYIWAVNAGHIVDASLGYFINPLINVLIGALLLHERLRRPQWIAVALAAAGVAWLTWQAGQVPWIGLSLALSFGFYGLLRKQASVGAIEGLAVETALLAPAAAAWLLWLALHGQSQFFNALSSGPSSLVLLLVLAGPITAIPLMLFAAGARRIPFATLGLLQYAGPTVQMLVGVHLYGEEFGGTKLAGYALIWLALAVFSGDMLLRGWRARNADSPAAPSA